MSCMKGSATDASVYGSSVVVLVATMIDASVSDISLASERFNASCTSLSSAGVNTEVNNAFIATDLQCMSWMTIQR